LSEGSWPAKQAESHLLTVRRVHGIHALGGLARSGLGQWPDRWSRLAETPLHDLMAVLLEGSIKARKGKAIEKKRPRG
jgi:hypothetical protein